MSAKLKAVADGLATTIFAVAFVIYQFHDLANFLGTSSTPAR